MIEIRCISAQYSEAESHAKPAKSQSQPTCHHLASLRLERSRREIGFATRASTQSFNAGSNIDQQPTGSLLLLGLVRGPGMFLFFRKLFQGCFTFLVLLGHVFDEIGKG